MAPVRFPERRRESRGVLWCTARDELSGLAIARGPEVELVPKSRAPEGRAVYLGEAMLARKVGEALLCPSLSIVATLQ